MSHAVLLIISGEFSHIALNAMLAPYEETSHVTSPFVRKKVFLKAGKVDVELSAAIEARREQGGLAKQEEYKELKTFRENDDLLGFAEWYGAQVDQAGNWYRLRNPNAKWHRWKIGGQWSGMLQTRAGKLENLSRVGELTADCLDKLCTYAVLDERGWHERDTNYLHAPRTIPKGTVSEYMRNKYRPIMYKARIKEMIDEYYVLDVVTYKLRKGATVPDRVMEEYFFQDIVWRKAFHKRFLAGLPEDKWLMIIEYYD